MESVNLNAAADAAQQLLCELSDLARLGEVNDLTLPVAAARYVQAGVAIFALKPGSKRPHTRHGLLDATTDVAQVEQWWADHPESNIGIATGTLAGDALDVDVSDGKRGMSSFYALRAAGLAASAWATASTPSGGLHLFYAPSGLRSTVRPRLGLDVRAAGGYVVAAPSVVNGNRYRWRRIDVSRYGAPLPWPEIVALLDPPRLQRVDSFSSSRPVVLSEVSARLARKPHGARNTGLYWACRDYVKAGADPAELAQIARAIGLTPSEIRRTIRSATEGAQTS